MTSTRFYLQDLLGRLVHDESGKPVGRIFDVRAEENDNGDLEVVEYLLGTAAMMERVGLSLLSIVGARRIEPRRIAWEQLDLSDVEHPVLRG